MRRLRRLRAQAPPGAGEQAMELVLRSATIDYVARNLLTGNRRAEAEDDPADPAQHAVLRAELEAFTRGELSAGQRAELAALATGSRLVIEAARTRSPISERWLLALHGALCAPQQSYWLTSLDGFQKDLPLPKGAYKKRPNHVIRPDGSIDPHAPVKAVPREVRRLIAELDSPGFTAAHPAVQAAYAICGLLAIHPFADGNGRTARALASLFLYRATGVPFLVFFDQRLAYRDALNATRSDRFQPLVDFVFEAALAAMELMATAIRAVRAPAATLKRLERSLPSG